MAITNKIHFRNLQGDLSGEATAAAIATADIFIYFSLNHLQA